MSVNEMKQSLIDNFTIKEKLNFIAYLLKNDYFYGWFEDPKIDTGEGVIIARVNLKTGETDKDSVFLAPLKWGINYDDFINVE